MKPKITMQSTRIAKWKGYTAVELEDGVRVRVYHRSPNGKESWTHPYKERCEFCPTRTQRPK